MKRNKAINTEAADNYTKSQAEYAERRSKTIRDIGELPKVGKPKVKAKCRKSLLAFCQTYFPEVFYLEFSEDHLKVIETLQRCILHGQRFALAMPRGYGKSTLCRIACLWAVLYGHRRFIVIIGATDGAAEENLETIQEQLESNELLLRDFPEVCVPLVKLGGIKHKASGQLYRGERTKIEWTKAKVVLPTVAGSAASGAIIVSKGITSRLRGLSHKGERPDCCMIDDAQTEESAYSPSQCNQRERIIARTILRLAGPDKSIACSFPATIVTNDDLAARILDHKKNPEWQGQRFQLMYSMPSNEKLWDDYHAIYIKSFDQFGDCRLATNFYQDNQAAMDEGGKPAWPKMFRRDKTEISAIQMAMNLRFENDAMFMAEYQNEPKPDSQLSGILKPDYVMQQLNGLNRGEIPAECTTITAAIDVQKNALYYTVCGWGENYNGWIIDYGVYPEQFSYHKYSEIQKTLATIYPNETPQKIILLGLQNLLTRLNQMQFIKNSGEKVPLSLIFVDSGYETETIFLATKSMPFTNILCSKGIGIGAKNRPMSEYHRDKGDRLGFHWYMPPVKDGQRHIRIDTNFWKSFVTSRLLTPITNRGSISLWGKLNCKEHRLISEHLCSEFPTQVSSGSRVLEEWQQKPNRPDNHWFDTLVMSCCAANLAGINDGVQQTVQPKPVQPRRRLNVTF